MRKSTTGSHVLEKAHDLYSDSKDMARNGAERAKTFVHESPVLSTILGVGAGILIGIWMRRRD